MFRTIVIGYDGPDGGGEATALAQVGTAFCSSTRSPFFGGLEIKHQK